MSGILDDPDVRDNLGCLGAIVFAIAVVLLLKVLWWAIWL